MPAFVYSRKAPELLGRGISIRGDRTDGVTRVDCSRQISDALAALDLDPQRVPDFLAVDLACVAQLVALDAECSAALAAAARTALANARDDASEYKLQALIRALVQRKEPAARALVVEALASTTATDKEAYLSFLVELDDPRAAPAVLAFAAARLARVDDHGNEDWALIKAIEALRYYRVEQAAPVLIGRLGARAERERREVIDFFAELDLRSAAPAFTERLEREDDPDNLAAIAAALASWHYAAALPGLQRLRDTGAARDDGDLRDAVTGAIARLTAAATR